MPATFSHAALRVVLAVWVSLFMLNPALAQMLPGFGGDGSQTTSAQSDLADALREAAQSGVSVVVIDSTGKDTSPPWLNRRQMTIPWLAIWKGRPG